MKALFKTKRLIKIELNVVKNTTRSFLKVGIASFWDTDAHKVDYIESVSIELQNIISAFSQTFILKTLPVHKMLERMFDPETLWNLFSFYAIKPFSLSNV